MAWGQRDLFPRVKSLKKIQNNWRGHWMSKQRRIDHEDLHADKTANATIYLIY